MEMGNKDTETLKRLFKKVDDIDKIIIDNYERGISTEKFEIIRKSFIENISKICGC